MKALLLSLLAISLVASSIDSKDLINSKQIDNKVNSFLEDIDKKAKKDASKNVASAMLTQGVDKDLVLKMEQAISHSLDPEKVVYFLYLTSKSVPNSSIRNFLYGVDKLNKKGYEIKGRAVYNGFTKEMNPKEFMDDLNVTTVKHSDININPFVFEDLKINSVPALVIANCPEKFKSKYCDYKYVIKGEVPLEKSLLILSDKEAKYEDMYFSFISPD